MKVLLTGGSGFIAGHCLETLLNHKHSVVTTVRSATKGDKILSKYPNIPKSELSYIIIEDIAEKGAFDKVFKQHPTIDAVLHTASPFHFNFTKTSELLDPAIHGTANVLEAIRTHGSNVKRVVITSSFAAMAQVGTQPAVYDESQWNPVTYEQGLAEPAMAYRASKTLAERTAWEFVEKEKPGFTLATICPPYVFGPLENQIDSLKSVNTSNQYFVSLLQGGWKEKIPPTYVWFYVDVRDVALAHVRAMEVPEAGGKRFFVLAGHFDMKQVADIAKKNFPDVEVPMEMESDTPENVYGYDNSRSKDILGLTYLPLEKTVVDSIESLKMVPA